MKRSTSSFLLLTFLLFGIHLTSFSQEFNCRVTVNSVKIQTTERQIFDEMEVQFAKFINDRKWTEDRFENDEKIRCIFNITLETQPKIGEYTAALQVLSVRPIFNSNYETSIINFADRDFDFQYTQSQPMNYSENTFTNNLTSVLAYYANIILGYDYDSFSELGGELYYDNAWQIVNTAQSSGFNGWNQFNSIRNRYWWASNTIDGVMDPFRKAMYQYHIKGLDLMADKPEEARLNILEALKQIQTVNQAKPRSIMVIAFLDAKADELISIFSQGDMAIRLQAYDILKQIDPARTDEFKKIIAP